MTGFTGFLSSNGLWVCADISRSGEVIADRQARQQWEDFEVISLSGDLVALKARANGKFVCAEMDKSEAPLTANRDWVRGWETFKYITVAFPPIGGGPPTIALKASNGKIVCADRSQGNRLFANRDWILEWEHFYPH